jgi:hypothetical protein
MLLKIRYASPRSAKPCILACLPKKNRILKKYFLSSRTPSDSHRKQLNSRPQHPQHSRPFRTVFAAISEALYYCMPSEEKPHSEKNIFYLPEYRPIRIANNSIVARNALSIPDPFGPPSPRSAKLFIVASFNREIANF